jgi:hypothetical protein
MSVLVLNYKFNQTLATPLAGPTDGEVRFDAAYPYTAVSKVWLNQLTADGADMRTVLLLLVPGTDVYVQDLNASTNFGRFTLTAPPVMNGAFVELPVVYRDAGVSLLNNQVVMAILVTPAQVGPQPEPGGPATPFVRPPWASPVGAWSVLVTRPAFEPLTLEQAKLRAGLDWPADDPRDALMTELVAAARAKVELDTALAIPMQTRDVYLTVDDSGLIPLPSQCTPCQSIEAVTTPDGLALPPSLFRINGPTLFTDTLPGGEYVVRVVAGWPTADALVTEAPLLYHAVALMTAHLATAGRDLTISGTIATVPYGYEDAIAPYRLVWVT